jgi:rfaE bifunctional protein kinase chain/domain
MRRLRVGVLGDPCLDAYWLADMTQSELSLETPHHPLPIVEERYSPGGAGNAAANLAALSPSRVAMLGVLGEDWRGELLTEALATMGVTLDGIVRSTGRITHAYIKPLRKGYSDVVYEDPRLDFENARPLPDRDEESLITSVLHAAPNLDALCICDQFDYGCVTERVRQTADALGGEGLLVVADSRKRAGFYRHAIIKPNEKEAAEYYPEAAPEEAALAFSKRNGKPALVTVGADGCFASDGMRVWRIPAIRVKPPLDTVGAGDTFLAAFTLAAAGGATLPEAAFMGNLASSVTIRKIGVTGSATPSEILSAYDSLPE